MDRDFLEKRKKDLNAYLQVMLLCDSLYMLFFFYCHAFFLPLIVLGAHLLQLLLNPEMVKACPTLIPYVYDFLENKAYSKGKGEFARKVFPFLKCKYLFNCCAVCFCFLITRYIIVDIICRYCVRMF